MKERLDYRLIFNWEEAWDKAKQIMEGLNLKSEKTINDILEYEHVIKLISKLEGISDEWKKHISEFEECIKQINELVGRYFGCIDNQNCKQIYDELELIYKEDFWELFEKYKVFKKIDPFVFEDIIMNSKCSIYHILDILVREYRCSGGTDTANPAAGNRCSGTEIPHLIDCYLRVHSLKAGSNPYTSRIDR